MELLTLSMDGEAPISFSTGKDASKDASKAKEEVFASFEEPPHSSEPEFDKYGGGDDGFISVDNVCRE